MKKHLSWIALSAALCVLPACSVAPAGTSSPVVTSPLPAQVSPLPQTPMSETTSPTPVSGSVTNAPQVDQSLVVPTPAPASTAMEAGANTPAVQAAIAALSKQLNVDAQSIKVISVEQVDWPDGCLGLSKPDQMCTQVIVPGYRVMLDANGTQHEVRASLNGRQVAIAPQ